MLLVSAEADPVPKRERTEPAGHISSVVLESARYRSAARGIGGVLIN